MGVLRTSWISFNPMEQALLRLSFVRVYLTSGSQPCTQVALGNIRTARHTPTGHYVGYMRYRNVRTNRETPRPVYTSAKVGAPMDECWYQAGCFMPQTTATTM